MIVACPGCQKRYDVSGRPAGTEARCGCGRRFHIPKASDEVGTRTCGNCGGAVRANDPVCPYCDSPVAQVRCPKCLGLVAAGGRHCQHCGTRVTTGAAALSGETRGVNCPRCANVRLESLLMEELAIDHCTRCGGLWLDHKVFARLQREEAVQAPAMLRVAELPSPAPATRVKPYIPCPECTTLMNPRNFAGCSGVIVDECRNHGVWFDAGELASIIQFVRDGGLDKAREKELRRLEEKKRQDKLKASLDRVRDARVAPPGYGASSFGRRTDGFALSDAVGFLSSLFS